MYASLRTASSLSVIMLATVDVQSVAAAQIVQGGYHRYYFDQRQSLTLDLERIALLQVGEDGGLALAEGLPQFGIAPEQVTRWPISGWLLTQTPVKRRTAPDIEQLVGGIAQDPGIHFVSPVFVGDDGGPLIPTRDILVRFNPGIGGARQDHILAEVIVGTVLDRDWANMPGAYRIRSHSHNGFVVLEQANALARRPEVRWAEPDMIFTGRGSLIPNDPGFDNCWGLHNKGQMGGTPDMDMDAPEAWDITTGNPNIIVLIMDTGVQQDHPDINQIAGADFTGEGGGGGPVNACDNHGTAVAGCVSATINNNLGTVGVAPDSRVASARIFISNEPCDGSWSAYYSWGVDALAWAESIGVRVTNNSNSYGGTSSALEDKYDQTRNNGMIHFASAGNNSSSTISYPASLSTVNAIAALDEDGNLTSFSNYGNGLAFSAPGVDIYTTDRTGSAGWVGGDYVWAWGTSFAAPYSAGVAALVLSQEPSLDAFEVENRLYASCADLGAPGYDTTFGWGFVNARQALLLCGNSACDPGENQCNCPADCGPPDPNEIGLCADGLDNDCDGFTDCADGDCADDPACGGATCPASQCVGGDCTLTQSLDTATNGENQVACGISGVGTTVNGWARCYNLTDEGVPAGNFTIDSVTFGVQQATIDGINVDVVLYLDSDGCPPVAPGDDAGVLATESVVVNMADVGTMITVEFPGAPVVPAGVDLIVEINQVDDGTVPPEFQFRTMSNDGGQCGPSYLRAADCGSAGWDDLADLGFPDAHLIQIVSGSVGGVPAGACCFPDQSCQLLTEAACAAAGGTYQGDGTTCTGGICTIIPPECNADAGPCDQPNGTPGCENELCCAAVCAIIPICCSIEWDQTCVDIGAKLPECAPGPVTCDVEGDPTLTQSFDQTIVAFNSVACSPDGGVTTTENSFARSYNLDTKLPGEEYTIHCIEWGIEVNSQGVDVTATVNIYNDTNGGAPQAPGVDLVLLGSQELAIPGTTDEEILVTTFDPPVVVGGGGPSIIVVELDVPDYTDVTGIRPGSNPNGQSAPSYIRSASCGLDEYADLASIGFPDMHLVNSIIGVTAGGPDPCPADLNGDGVVNPSDLAILLGWWGLPGADLNGDGTTNPADLAILLANWGECP